MAERERIIDLHDEQDPGPVKTYKIDALCLNCDWRGEVEIPKGTPCEKGKPLGQTAKCPDCECFTLVRQIPEQDPPRAIAPVQPMMPLSPYIEERRRRPVTPLPQPDQPWQHFGPYYGDPPNRIGVPYVGDPPPNTQPTWVAPQPNDVAPRIVMSTALPPAGQPNANGDAFTAEALNDLASALDSAGVTPQQLADAEQARAREAQARTEFPGRAYTAEGVRDLRDRLSAQQQLSQIAHSWAQRVPPSHIMAQQAVGATHIQAGQGNDPAAMAAAQLMQAGLISQQTAFDALGLTANSIANQRSVNSVSYDKNPGSPAY